MSFEQPVGQSGTGHQTRRRLQLALKRLLDILLSVVVLLLSWPVLLLIAILVKRSSPGPVFFVQERAGLGQKPFPMFKFRTMVEALSKQQATVWTAAEEARIGRSGSFAARSGSHVP